MTTTPTRDRLDDADRAVRETFVDRPPVGRLRGRLGRTAGWYSSLVGRGARLSIPRPLRAPLYRAFARVAGADLAEAGAPLTEYDSFGDFFARRLRQGARQFELPADALASPSDGLLAVSGRLDAGSLIQAKGREYHVDQLLAEPGADRRFAGGWYATVYLSPADYHRVHAPIAGEIVAYDYVPGALWPVKPYFTRKVEGLFTRNERAIVHMRTAVGPVAVVLVAAIGVGNLYLSHLPVEGADLPGGDSRTWRAAGEHRRIDLARPVRVERGDELGAFLLGSTVVMVFPPGAVREECAPAGEPIRCGQLLARTGGGGRS